MGEYNEGDAGLSVPPEVIEALNRINKDAMRLAVVASPRDTIDDMDLTGAHDTPERRMRYDVWVREMLASSPVPPQIGGDTAMPLVLASTGRAYEFRERALKMRNPFA